jgi:hypothetical protein
VRQFAQKALDQSKVVENFQRGWMNGVAPKIAQEVRVFFEDDNRHPGSRQEQSKNRASRAAARDATAD